MADPRRDKMYDRADKAISNLRKSKDKNKDKRIKAWQKHMDHESAQPYNDYEKKLFSKGNKVLKDMGHKPKQKAGIEAKKLRGMSKALKKSHGSPSKAAKDPKVSKKVDRIYNKMLDDKGKNLGEQYLKEISIKKAMNAYDGAKKKGKTQQADKFANYAYKKRIKSDEQKSRIKNTVGRGGSPYDVWREMYDAYMEMYIKDMGKSMSYKVTPNEKKPSTKKKPMSSDRQKKLDNMISRGTPNERAVAKKKLSGPSLPNLK